MIRCDNASPTILSMSSLINFAIQSNLSNLDTSSSSIYDICVGCNYHNGDDTDLNLVPIRLSSITSICVLLVPSSFEPTSLSSNILSLK